MWHKYGLEYGLECGLISKYGLEYGLNSKHDSTVRR
jgi:hypothetical protein